MYRRYLWKSLRSEKRWNKMKKVKKGSVVISCEDHIARNLVSFHGFYYLNRVERRPITTIPHSGRKRAKDEKVDDGNDGSSYGYGSRMFHHESGGYDW